MTTNIAEQFIKSITKNYNFSHDQEAAFLDIIEGGNVLLSGSAGSGKSYLLSAIKDFYKDKIALTSTTGISSLNVGGRTLHSFFGIYKLDKFDFEKTINKIVEKSGKEIRRLKAIVIEECSMLDSFVFTLVDYAMRQIMNINVPFGGKQIILVGDFMQLPPVDCLTQIFECDSFLNGNFKIHYLTSNHRQDVNSEFYKILQECRYNKLSRQSLMTLRSRETDNPPHDILHLYATNKENDSWNTKMFNKLSGKIKNYLSDDYVAHSAYAKYLDNGCLAERELKLKNNARVILLRNLDFERGLVNGSCGYVRDMQKNQVVVEFDNGEMQTIKPAVWEWTQRDEVVASRKQIPLKLAYSITVHKSQGMTLDRAYIDLTKIFAEGQAYVALSRLRTLDGLYLKGVKSTSFRTNVKARQFYEQIENELKER